MSGAEVRAFRERLGWSLDRLAGALSVDRMTVWRWEQEARQAPPYLRLALERLVDLHAR